MKITPTVLTQNIVIDELYSVHYFEFSKNYYFAGESHPFWEFVYVDKGEIDICMGDEHHRLKQGNIAFHQPNEYHNLSATGTVAPNIIVVSFKCASKFMDFFKKRILPLSDFQKTFLSTIVRETEFGFSSSLKNTFLTKLQRREDATFGSEQIISMSLEHLLISLYRDFGKIQRNTTSFKRGIQQGLIDSILIYMQEHIHEKITIDQIAEAVGMSKTSISMLFKEKLDEGVISYFTKNYC